MKARLIYSHEQENWLKVISAKIIIPKSPKLSEDLYL